MLHTFLQKGSGSSVQSDNVILPSLDRLWIGHKIQRLKCVSHVRHHLAQDIPRVLGHAHDYGVRDYDDRFRKA